MRWFCGDINPCWRRFIGVCWGIVLMDFLIGHIIALQALKEITAVGVAYAKAALSSRARGGSGIHRVDALLGGGDHNTASGTENFQITTVEESVVVNHIGVRAPIRALSGADHSAFGDDFCQ